ncbi:hypothetical protein NEF87_001169 [Candidatus Lokiarchaeum ossiferum]|uniref:Protein translocase SEC61 complex subunit gamma n=1 Tax=Candidatus Lokiarchaeum ossiferum TaxID=2951803 RepID=A0ABY6HQM5_9ARCH|nr:hypothetical protein NEF87_001169 [Candidatus Lokiarchaeum sp. B-35]
MTVDKDAPTLNKIQKFWLNTKRIITISTKPTRKEYFTMMKVCLIGIGIIGGLSYIFQLIFNFIPF